MLIIKKAKNDVKEKLEKVRKYEILLVNLLKKSAGYRYCQSEVIDQKGKMNLNISLHNNIVEEPIHNIIISEKQLNYNKLFILIK